VLQIEFNQVVQDITASGEALASRSLIRSMNSS
jgi:hypothetical protein